MRLDLPSGGLGDRRSLSAQDVLPEFSSPYVVEIETDALGLPAEEVEQLTLKQVVETTGNAQISTPLSHLEGSTPGTGGLIETPQQRLGVRHVFEKLTNPKELGKVPVEGTGGRLRLSDVADVSHPTAETARM